MGRFCREAQEWVEERIERPITTAVERTRERCRRRPWWDPRRWFCELITVIIQVVTWVVVTVGKWVMRVVCEFVNFFLDLVSLLALLILSIPIIGGILRTILNWLTEIICRIVGIFDFIGGLLGIRPRKKMYVGLVIPSLRDRPVTTEAAMLPQITALQNLFDTTCNINVIYTGACTTSMNLPADAANFNCGVAGFFSDWGFAGSYFELASAACKFRDTFRRVIGLGAEILVFPVPRVLPGTTAGCSLGPTTNYVVVEPTATPFVTTHEVGHACGLPHVPADAGNLMFATVPFAAPTLTRFQIAWIRGSRHVVYW